MSSDHPDTDWLPARQAAALLQVSLPTLYTYVSRGLLHPLAQDGQRGKRYRRAEVERLRLRHEGGHRPRRAAQAALDFGLPVLASRLCLIEHGRLHYRGQDAIALAETATLESVATLLWDSGGDALQGQPPALSRRGRAALSRLQGAPLPQRLQAAYAVVQDDWAAAFLDAQARPAEAGRLAVQAMGIAVTLQAPRTHDTRPWHELLCGAWSLPSAAADAVRRALVLCADHELNVSSFTARCVASADAPVEAAVGAALAALGGRRHGGLTLQVEALWPTVQRLQAGGPAAIDRWLDRHAAAPPGFGHPLYPDGDPRAAALIAALPARLRPQRMLAAVERRHGLRPTLDFGLAALLHGLGAPAGSGFALFALARSVGWVAHVLEQQQAGALIRPRAAYEGRRPSPTPEVMPARVIRRR